VGEKLGNADEKKQTGENAHPEAAPNEQIKGENRLTKKRGPDEVTARAEKGAHAESAWGALGRKKNRGGGGLSSKK